MLQDLQQRAKFCALGSIGPVSPVLDQRSRIVQTDLTQNPTQLWIFPEISEKYNVKYQAGDDRNAGALLC